MITEDILLLHDVLLLDLPVLPDDVGPGQLPGPLVRDAGDCHLHHSLVLADQVLQLTWGNLSSDKNYEITIHLISTHLEPFNFD